MISSALRFLITTPVFTTSAHFRLLQGRYTVFSSVSANSLGVLILGLIDYSSFLQALIASVVFAN